MNRNVNHKDTEDTKTHKEGFLVRSLCPFVLFVSLW
jgi:hypothetical protein